MTSSMNAFVSPYPSDDFNVKVTELYEQSTKILSLSYASRTLRTVDWELLALACICATLSLASSSKVSKFVFYWGLYGTSSSNCFNICVASAMSKKSLGSITSVTCDVLGLLSK